MGQQMRVLIARAPQRLGGRSRCTRRQSVQPWQFGSDPHGPDNVKKRTCLWLRGLPKLTPTGTLDGSTARDEIHKASPGPDRAERRSRFFPGLASAMAGMGAGTGGGMMGRFWYLLAALFGGFGFALAMIDGQRDAVEALQLAMLFYIAGEIA